MSRKCQQVTSTYREESLFHNPYGQEQREQDAIRNGDLDALEASFREVYPGKVGTLSASPLRHTKNLAVVLITLASRSAIAGGLLPEIAYSMSDAFIQRTEELTAEGEVVALARQAEIEFCQQVRALAGHSSNLLIARCKDLVFRNMHTHVEIRELAEQLGVNANYLSQLFNREEGGPPQGLHRPGKGGLFQTSSGLHRRFPGCGGSHAGLCLPKPFRPRVQTLDGYEPRAVPEPVPAGSGKGTGDGSSAILVVMHKNIYPYL